MKKHFANSITVCRILCSMGMMFFPVFSSEFFITYLLCGLTDMTDGVIARKTKTVSAFGSLLDSAADFVFLALASIKLLPAMDIPGWLWSWILIILFIKAVNLLLGFTFKKKLVVEHTVMNKFTGLLLFFLPLTLPFLPLNYSAPVVSSAAVVAAVQEGYYILMNREIG